MGKVKEYFDRFDDWHSGKNSREPKETPKRHKKGRFDDLEGQMSFISDDGVNLRVDQGEEQYRLRAIRRKEDILAYYDAFYDLLNKYGKLNMSLSLLEAINGSKESGIPMSDNVRNTINYHYDGKEENVERSAKFARKHLKDARKNFAGKGLNVGLDDPEINRYVAEYRDKDRRDRYRFVLKKERNKVFGMDPVEVLEKYDLWRPFDFEADYQTLRAKRDRRKQQ